MQIKLTGGGVKKKKGTNLRLPEGSIKNTQKEGKENLGGNRGSSFWLYAMEVRAWQGTGGVGRCRQLRKGAKKTSSERF